MNVVSTPTTTVGPEPGRLSALAGEAELLARTDPAAAGERLETLRGLVAGDPRLAPTDAAGVVRIVDQLEADLRTGAVRSITGLARRLRQLEKLAT